MSIVTIRAIALSFIVLMLTGCYESEVPLIERGERTALSGSFKCQDPGSKSSFDIRFSEIRGGSGRLTSYRYEDGEAHSYMFKKLSSGLFLGQAKGERSLSPFQIDTEGFEFAFVRFLDANTFMAYLDDMDQKWPQIEKLLEKHQPDYKWDDDLLLLAGSKEKTLRFLAAHDKTLLKEPTRCERVKTAAQ